MKQSRLPRNKIVTPGDTPSLAMAYLYVGAFYLLGVATAIVYVELLGGNGYQQLLTGKALVLVSLGGALYTLLIAWYVHLFRWRDLESIVRALTRSGLCASCGYTLATSEPEPDGCTVCPECGAAWRMQR